MTSLILDSAPVAKSHNSNLSSSSSSYHGELFYATFKSTVIDFLVTAVAAGGDVAVCHLVADEAVIGCRQSIIASVLTSMLDAVVVTQDSVNSHRYFSTFHLFRFFTEHLIFYNIV